MPRPTPTSGAMNAGPTLWQRFEAALTAFFARPDTVRLYPPSAAYGRMELCPGLTYEPQSDGSAKLVIDRELTLEGEHNLTIATKKHLFLQSGQTPEPDRPGYNYSIWENSNRRDAQGRPIALIPIWDEADAQHFIPVPLTPDGHRHVDERGYPVCPEGYYAVPRYVRDHAPLP